MTAVSNPSLGVPQNFAPSAFSQIFFPASAAEPCCGRPWIFEDPEGDLRERSSAMTWVGMHFLSRNGMSWRNRIWFRLGWSKN